MHRWGRRAVVIAAATVAVSCSGDTAAPSTTSTAPVTSTAPTTDAVRSTTTTTTVTTSTVRPTTTIRSTATTTSTTTTTTTTEAPRPEAARRRPADVLPRPAGYARHEPLPAWEGEAALTGLPIDPAIEARPALAVKIDNAPGARPQWNLADADLVFEENVEGITRFVAVFHSTTPDRIGPVRSARTSDLDILSSLNRPILAWSGGNPGVTFMVRDAHQLGWFSNLSALSTTCFWRSGRTAPPHNLVLDPLCAWESTTYAGPARPVFARGAASGGRPEDRFDVRMDGVSVSWAWDGATGIYRRRQAGDWHLDADGDPIHATNVVVLDVGYVTSVADAESPEAVTVGSGRAVVHRDGRAIDGVWSRPDRFAPFTLAAPGGEPILLAPGSTFVELER